MAHLTQNFLRGLFTLLPLFLSIYVIFWVFNWVEKLADRLVLWVIPDFLYFPGLGILVGFLIIYGFGLLLIRPKFREIYEKVEVPFTSVPFVKSVYFAIKDLTAYFTPSEEKKASKVVMVKMPDSPIEVVGLLTRNDLDELPEGITKEDKVAVYFPMSYQIGGYTLFIPRSWIRELDLDVESAMRMTLTAWMPGGDRKKAGFTPLRRKDEESTQDNQSSQWKSSQGVYGPHSGTAPSST